MPNKLQFESAEHTFLGDQMTLQFETGPVSAAHKTLYVGASSNGGADPKNLTFGQVLALGGDVYGRPDRPISTDPDPRAAFIANYATLAGGSSAELAKILAIMQKEIDLVNDALAHGRSVTDVYDKLGDTLSYELNAATGGGNGPLPRGRYLMLSSVNWDHFGDHAVAAYRAGHAEAVAMASAIKASNKTTSQKQASLEKAYATTAFACHFLTDLFSAGHLRTPRKELYDAIIPSVVGSLLSRCMHDEDSKNGLKVSNARGETWTAYGDKRLFDPRDKVNFAQVLQAVQVSCDEVYAAYVSGSSSASYEALSYVPTIRPGTPVTRDNPSPLFTLGNGTVLCRNSLGDPQDYSWTQYWVGATTWAELQALGYLFTTEAT
jgi:hypothetical protein